jgi:hypothetical protein
VTSGKKSPKRHRLLVGEPKGRSEEMDTLLAMPEGLLSGLQAQSEIRELLDEIYLDGLM